MLWKWCALLVLSLLMAGCTLIPEMPTLPTQVRPPEIYSTSDALRAAIEGDYPLDALTIRYKVGNPGWGGHTTLAARGNGTAEVTFEDEDGQETWHANLTEAEVSALVRMLVDRQIWAIRGQREIGAPDEAYPTVIVEAEGFEALEVAMWDGEARKHPEFRAVLDVLSGLASEISGGVAR
jgi:hypothetical protein